jgi:co-chaperonin GroES (HSP10)
MKMPTMTPRLRNRLDYFKVEPPPWMPLHDRVFVVMIGSKDEEEGTEVEMPDGTKKKVYFSGQTKETMAAQKGLVVAAGAAGWEQLYAMGIQIGDIVVCNRLSRWEKAYTVNGKVYGVLICRAGEITAGVDLYEYFQKGDLWYEMDRQTGKVQVADREESRDRNDPEFVDDGTV